MDFGNNFYPLIHRIQVFVLMVFSFAALSSCNDSDNSKIVWNPQMANSLDELKAGFNNPSIDFSPAPLWVWNDKVTNEKIDFDLEQFKDKGIHMVFIHPRPGLITEYLSNEWFELVKHTVDKARELDMKVWLYDENSYPSGFAGGHVPAATFSTSDPIAGLTLKRLETLSETDTTSYFLILKQMGNTFANITNSKNKYYGQPGNYYAFTKWYYPKGEGWYGGFSYVDLLAYGITEKFIKLTMDGYEEYIGNEFGKLVPGIFTDEPNINTIGGPRSVIRYTPVLFNRFEKKYGYQLEPYLPCLYDEIGDWKNVRHDYYALLLEMFTERWSEPWQKYTDDKAMKWTGHYWEHGWPDPKHGADNMAMYEYHQYPGIDMLFNSELRADQFGNIRSVKELSSVVNQLDKARALSETYGGSGWELTFNDMKRQGDWEYVLGVNFMNPHLSHMTLKGARKRDYPQSMSYHTPWWENYKPLNDYFRRLSFALTAGKQVNRILILEPTSTSWMLYSPLRNMADGPTPPIEKLKEEFQQLLTLLEKQQIEYDLGSESIIKNHGSVNGNKFVVGSRAYDLVVLPPMFENLMGPTYELLLNYLNGGGKVLSLGGFPARLDGNASTSMAQELGKFPDQWIKAETVDQQILKNYLSQNDFQPENPGDWGGDVFHMRRILKDGQLYFFTNYDKGEMANISFSGKGKSVTEFDLMTGEYHLLDVAPEEGMVNLSFSLLPSGSKLLFISENSGSGEKMHLNPDPQGTPIQTSPSTITRLSPNTFTIDYCDVSVANKSFKDIYFFTAADTIFKVYLKDKYGPHYNPWSNAVQYRTRLLDKNTFDENSGFEVNYHFLLDEAFTPTAIKAVFESLPNYKIFINGNEINANTGDWWLDKQFSIFDIASQAKPGRNTLTIKAQPMDILAEVEPIYLVGEFGVVSTDAGWKLIPDNSIQIGSWKMQHMPFYSQSVVYSKTIEKPATGKVKVKLNHWKGTVAEVKVNGENAGIIGWAPNELEISDLLKEGENQVEVIVTGSLKNLMGPHHMNPEPGFVTPWSFINAPQHQPSGSEYDMLDYGLLEDFEIVSY